MTGIGLVLLLLALVGICSVLYMAAWWICNVRRNNKQGQYTIPQEEDDDDEPKLYKGLGKQLSNKNHP